tara:strand:+ start:392 stop:547 length:156 start_codon:yes stop_codon:yes gene_type:complete
MPIWMRRFHIQKINEYHEKQNEELEKVKNKNQPSSNKVTGPNVTPTSNYNF